MLLATKVSPRVLLHDKICTYKMGQDEDHPSFGEAGFSYLCIPWLILGNLWSLSYDKNSSINLRKANLIPSSDGAQFHERKIY